MRSTKPLPKATFESTWALIQENIKAIKAMQERDEKERIAWQERAEKESIALKEWKEQSDKSIKAMQQELGGVSNSNGKVAETYFVNSITNSMQFAGQEYDEIDHYLGLAAFHFEENTENDSIEQGIAIIKQVGENMVIYDEHLKVF